MIEDHIARLESEIRYLKGLLDKNGIPISTLKMQKAGENNRGS